jgi:hypothetical protein
MRSGSLKTTTDAFRHGYVMGCVGAPDKSMPEQLDWDEKMRWMNGFWEGQKAGLEGLHIERNDLKF